MSSCDQLVEKVRSKEVPDRLLMESELQLAASLTIATQVYRARNARVQTTVLCAYECPSCLRRIVESEVAKKDITEIN